MSKNPTIWHEACYRNAAMSIQGDIDRAKRDLSSALYRQAENEFRKIQLDEALQRGMNGFDEERFMKKERTAYMGKIRETFFGELKMEELV